jgi:hypothetical protein
LRKFGPFIIVPFVLAAVLLPGSAHTASKATALSGTVGPGFSIALRNANGVAISRLDPGAYTITIDDKSDLHNFHLKGPGSVELATSVEGLGKTTWDVNLVDGVYTYHCDAHPTQMHGSFRVGAAPPPPARLNGRVGPTRTISLKNVNGRIVKVTPAGTYKVVVKDMTKADNFHLKGPGVNKRTGVKFKGTKMWTLKLAEGSYTYRSDVHPKLRRSFKAIKPPTQ